MTIASTGVQLYLKYKNHLEDMQANLQFIAESYLAPISHSIWDFDESNVRLQLDGILKLPGIKYCAISHLEDTLDATIEVGDPTTPRDVSKNYQLFYKEQQIGTLSVVVNFDYIYDDLMQTSILVIVSRGLEVFFIAIIILLIINQFLLRHFSAISSYAQNLDIDHLDEPLVLRRRITEDELQLVVTAINDMRLQIKKDLEDRKSIQRQLEFNHNLLAAQQETSSEGVLVVDSNDQILSHNQRFNEIWDVPEEIFDTGLDNRIIEHILDKLVEPDGFIARIKYLYSNKNEFSEDTIRLIDGRVIERNSGPIYGKDNNYFGRVWYFRDITQEALAEKSLSDSHKRFLTVLNSIDATIYVADMETYEILFMNKHMVESFGRDMTGEICWNVFREEGKPCGCCTNAQLVDSRGKPNGVHIWQDINPITGKYYVNHDRAIEWTDGRLVRLQIATDISDIKLMEEQLRQAQKMDSVGRLAGGVAHDYNNMLGIIIGYTELVIEKVDPKDPISVDLTEILTAAKRSTDITRQLLAFASKQPAAPKVLYLNDAIKNMLKMIRRLIGENIELVWRSGASVWPVKIDPSQVDQLVINLCVNARDAIIDVGKITIEADNSFIDEDYVSNNIEAVSGEYVVISISDNGSGIAPENLNKVFDPFYTTKERGKGTGLGLATVYGIVKQNNGFISVYSEPQKGTTIKLYLPRHKGTAVESQHNDDIKIPMSSGETLLLVEDDASILKLVQKMLESLEYIVLSTTSPTQAIDFIEQHKGDINLLITDVVMPEMNGRELSQRIKQIQPDINVLFMSGYTADIIAHRGVLEDGIHFISKPFSKKEMAVKIRGALEQIEGVV